MAQHISLGTEVLNVDWNPPLEPGQNKWWHELDIMDQAALQKAFDAFGPTHVVHLAARTDTDEQSDVDAYLQNHEGTRILLEVVKQCASVERIIITSISNTMNAIDKEVTRNS